MLPLEIPKHTQDIAAAIWQLDDDIFAYAVSFAVIGKFWLSHHRFYGSLDRFDNTLMGLNLLYLAWVVLVPFTSEMLGRFAEDSTTTSPTRQSWRRRAGPSSSRSPTRTGRA